MLQKGACPGPDLVGMGPDVISQHLGPAVCRFEKSKQEADGGGLAGGIRAEEAEDDTGRHLKGKTIDSPNLTEGPGEVLGQNGWLRHW